MLHEKIRNTSAQLGELAGRLAEEDYEVVRMARINLQALADCVATLEAHFCPPSADSAQEGA